ncbi:preprotein translocase subunit SecG [Candidatus Roizmanbacteria bacterium]|nr:preprotein translocase subunit SecG [Candidatus Roizmanbacteria bacterium]
MRTVLLVINIIIAILVLLLVLIQGKGAGLGSAWGGHGELYQTRRGVEKLTLRFTVILIIAFFILSVLNLFLRP